MHRMPFWAVVSVLVCAHAAAAQTCVAPGWLNTFADGDANPAIVYAEYDPDGAGPSPRRLVALTRQAQTGLSRIVAWNGIVWESMVAGPLNLSHLKSLAAVRGADGSETLYAGGFNHLTSTGVFARWNGSQWESLSPPTSWAGARSVDAMCSFDIDGAGPEPERLFALVSDPWNSITHSVLQRWDGSSWTTIGNEYFSLGSARAMISVSRQGFQGIYAACGGRHNGFQNHTVMRWDGFSTTTLETYGSHIYYEGVAALAFGEDVLGPSLYAAGWFEAIGGVPAHNVARWDGTGWHAADGGLVGGWIDDLTFFDPDGTGPQYPRLVATGTLFDSSYCLGSWNGAAWSMIGSFFAPRVRSFNDGVSSIFASGPFGATPDSLASNMTRSIGPFWVPAGQSLSGPVHALATVRGGSGAIQAGLYAGGAFYSAGQQFAYRIARWNGTTWSPVGSGTDHEVDALAFGLVWDQVGLFAGGKFSSFGSVSASRIARWNGSFWSPLDGGGLNDSVSAILPLENSIVVGGAFTATASGTTPLNRVAIWTGQAWVPLGNNLDGHVFSLALFNDGTDAWIYAGGESILNGQGIARWTGMQWEAVGAGLDGVVRSLLVHDDGTGAALYAAGEFGSSGAIQVANIARWDGTAWTGLGSGLNGSGRALKTLEVRNPGPPRRLLVVGGDFTTAGEVSSTRVAVWYLGRWFSPNGGVANNSVLALGEFDPDGLGPMSPSLIAGGTFTSFGSTSSLYIAEWRGCSACYANCDASAGSPLLTANDFLCFLNRFAAADPYANCDGSTNQPLLTANDFQCFINAFANGCN